MKGADVITFQIENSVQLRSILSVALRKAVIESPFDRTSNSVSEIIHANFERNVALGLFEAYTNQFNIPVSWKNPRRFDDFSFDFKWKEQSFLLMNKMFHGDLDFKEYEFLPALIPNRFEHDRWPSVQSNSTVDKASFVFTFLYAGRIIDSSHTYYDAFSPELASWLLTLGRRFKIGPVNDSPFTEEWFWNEVSRRGGLPQLKPGFQPTLIIAGVCLPEHYRFFADTDGLSAFAYALYTGKWYEVKSSGVLSFRQGMVMSKFKNATCPMAALPSFAELVKS